ncbi:MAG: tetratricopeptide repeat protein [Acidobacteriota bacterium]
MLKKLLLISLLLFLVFPYGCRKKVNTRPGYMTKGTPDYMVNQGYRYLNSGALRISEEKFKNALKKIPNHIKAINGLGIVYLKLKKFDKSLFMFKKVISLNPDQIDAYNFMGIIYSEKGEYEPAKENFLIAANSKIYQTPENAFVNLAMLELKKGKNNSALRYIEKGITKNSEFTQLYNLRGTIYEMKGFYKKAVQSYERALLLSSADNVSLRINIARSYLKMGQKIKARNLLEKMLGEAPSENIKKQIRSMIKEAEK